MRRHPIIPVIQAALLLSIGALAACHRQPAVSNVAVDPPFEAIAAIDDEDLAKILPDTGPFWDLGAGAIADTPMQLDKAMEAAEAANEDLANSLIPTARTRMDAQLLTLRAAHQADDRIGVALSALEIYRVLATSGPTDAIPPQVRLLGYSGLRYGADLAAKPVRWDDAATTAADAADLWGQVAAQITDPALHGKVDQVLADMKAAASSKDEAAAAKAAKALVALDDQLIDFFLHRPRQAAPASAP